METSMLTDFNSILPKTLRILKLLAKAVKQNQEQSRKGCLNSWKKLTKTRKESNNLNWKVPD